MENATLNCPDDQEVFRRVWSRVMPEEREDCPIEVNTVVPVDLGGDLPCACICPASAAPREEPGLPTDMPCPHRDNDFPDLTDVHRLGPASAPYGALLQKQTMDALEAWQLYRHLARRSTGRGGRMLAELASEKHHAARRLAAAQFLISGVRYWPADRLSAPRIPSYLGTIRQAYQAELQREQAYLMSSSETEDEALQELFLDLAAQSVEHSRLLRTLLEQGPL